MIRGKYTRGIFIAIFVIVITTFNFLNLEESECIRAIHVVTLLVCGAGIGLLLENVVKLIREKRN